VNVELPVLSAQPPPLPSQRRDDRWLRAAGRARLLAWVSLAWMTAEGIVGVLAGVEANSISLLTWAASSAVEGLASAIVIWRFTGSRTTSEHAEQRAQRWVAGSFFLLAPYFIYEAVHRLIVGEAAQARTLGIVLTATSVLGMPLLGYAKLRLGRRLTSAATAGEGVQNLLCAGQAGAALVALLAAGSLPWLDPIAALAIAAVAMKEGVELWRGEGSCCSGPLGFEQPLEATACADDCCSAQASSPAPPRACA
jgi:divalent metal cation (Fe/Co/Zn/Cd) transporter